MAQTRDAAWRALAARAEAARAHGLAPLFEAEPDRARRLTVEAAGLTADFSKQSFAAADLAALVDLAKAADLEGQRARLFAGDNVNATEKRPAMHMALRGPAGTPDQRREAQTMRKKARAFADAVRSGERTGGTGKRLRQILHIGIGGSDLGPRLVAEALHRFRDPAIDIAFVANIDPADINDALEGLDPETTLVVVASKTFATLETKANAEAAVYWLHQTLGAQKAGAHVAAVTARPDRAAEFGVAEDAVFAFPDWVGGRYSVWSPVSLGVEIALQEGVFDAFLAGAAAMDAHVQEAPIAANAPALMALAEIWNRNVMGYSARVAAPYAKRLRLLPQFLQQLEMESNGKGVTLDGAPVKRAAAPVVFGAQGTNAQHAFFQQLHQGSETLPVDFIGVLSDAEARPAQHRALLANLFAQAEAMMNGTPIDASPHKACPGGRPSTMLLLERLAPEPLGALLAAFEHKVFAEAAIWGINPFDQYGVELGKTVATGLLAELEGGSTDPKRSPSTAALIARARRHLG